jgi:eukaryotic-like serine/threonine-protein kinase
MMQLTRVQHFFFFLSSSCLVLLLAACGSTGSNGSTTPTPTRNIPTVNASVTAATTQPGNEVTTAPVPPTLISCPATGTARESLMPPLALGHRQNIVYTVNEFQAQTPTFGTLKRLDVTTGVKTEIVKIAGTSISDAQVSADGQWILFVSVTTNQDKIQLVRMDGQGLQTLYCASPASNGANPASALNNIEWSANQQLTAFNSYTGSVSYLYLLNMRNGTLQKEITTNSGAIDTPLTWLDNTRLYVNGPEVDAPPQALYILDISKGAFQNPNNLQKVFDASSVTGTTNFCWNADSSFNSTNLFTSQCTTTPNPNGPGIGSQSGPSTINVRPATGGAQQKIFTSQTMAITAVRSINQNTLLLLINTNGSGTNVETSQNGLWKVNTNGSGLTRLTTSGAGVSGGPILLCQFTQYPWSNVSRDGSMFAIQQNTANGQTQSLFFGSLSGGTSTTFASIADGTQLSIVGWTTM